MLQQAQTAADMPALAPAQPLPMSATRLENTFTCQPQQRNMHGRIFGGFLMRWGCCCCCCCWALLLVMSPAAGGDYQVSMACSSLGLVCCAWGACFPSITFSKARVPCSMHAPVTATATAIATATATSVQSDCK
jgi:hypothetical protein